MFLEVAHQLSFTYDAFIRESFLELRMQPKTTATQTLSSFVLAVGPPTKVSRYRDWNDNAVHHFTIVQFHDRIEVETRALVRTAMPEMRLADAVDLMPLAEPPYPLLDFLELGGPVRDGADLRAFSAEATVPPHVPLGEQVAALGRLIRERFEY